MVYNEKSPLLEELNKFDNSIENSLKWKLQEQNNHGKRKGASWQTGAFILVNTSLGAGLLNYPVAYDRLGGIGFATFIQIVLLLIVASTMLILTYCADLKGVSTYHEVLEHMCGHSVRQLAAVSILISCFGICVTFLIIIGDQFDRIFATFFGDQFCYDWYSNRIFTIALTTTVFIWPMSYFKRLDFLKHANTLGIFAMLYVIFLNIYEYYTLDVIPGPIKTQPDSIVTALAALPVVCFAYQSHEVIVPVYACLEERSTKNVMKLTGLSLAILFVFYCISGTFGYLTFGGTVAPDIMQMYNPSDPLVSIGTAALIIKMIATYPPVIYCGRDTFVGLFCNDPEPLPIDQTWNVKEFRNRIIITSVWNFVVLVLSLVTPNITIAIGFLGSLAAWNVFIFPGLCMVSLARSMSANEDEYQNKSRFSKALLIYGIFTITTGVLMFFIILFQVYSDLTGENKHELLCQ